jgi:AcrR family transcriptional regulator
MGRPARYLGADIVAGAREISVDLGPRNLTVAAVAQRTGVPIGSIYHRYASRDEILAAVWLDLVEEFQARFLAALEADDAVEAGLAAVRGVVAWVRRHPREARLLLLHRREDFAAERWPASYRRRAEELASRAAASMSRYAARLTGRSGSAELRRVRFALVDLPTATLKRDIEEGERPTPSTERLLLDTCAYALQRVRVEKKHPSRKTTTDEHR